MSECNCFKAVECSKCGNTVCYRDAESLDGKLYCKECYRIEWEKANTKICARCGKKIFPAIDNVKKWRGKFYCEHCYFIIEPIIPLPIIERADKDTQAKVDVLGLAMNAIEMKKKDIKYIISYVREKYPKEEEK